MKHNSILGGTDARDLFRLAPKHTTIVFPVLLLIFGIVVTSGCVGFTGKTGLIPSIALEVTPNPVDFGSVMVGSSASQTLTVTNSGQGKFTLKTVSASGPGFTISGLSAPQTLASGQSASLAVVFKPAVAGQENGNISVSIGSQGPQLVGSLKGAGSTTVLTVTPSVVSFGNVNVGSPVSQSLRLSNSSSASVAIKSVGATGPGFGISGLTTPQTLTPNESVNFTAEFNPKAAGAETGTISIETAGTPLTVGLNGAGVSAAQLVASAASLSFGSVTIGDTPSQQVILKNTGNASADISSVSLTGNSYTLSGVTSNLVLSPDQSANLMVKFSPKTTGSLPGKVTISSNAAGSPLVIQFSGTGADTSQQHSVALNWDQGTSQVVGYFIYRASKPSGPYTKLNSQASSETSYTDSSVASGQTYYYVVTSVNSENIESAYSGQVSVTVPSS
jgi:hypothetical protein